MPGPLSGVRVLDWSTWVAAPLASAMLGEMGAEVIKVEQAGVGDAARAFKRFYGVDTHIVPGRNVFFESCNWGKKGFAVDLRNPKGRAVMYRLVERSDVVIQNFRPGVAEKLGADYTTLAKRNPRLVYASVSGYGPKGPDTELPSFAPLVQARGGLNTLIGSPDNPIARLPTLTDEFTAISVVYSVMAALLARNQTGAGQEVKVSLLSGLLAALRNDLGFYLMMGSALPTFDRTEAPNPIQNSYKTKDDRWIWLNFAYSDRDWPLFCKAMDITHLEHDPKFVTSEARQQNNTELIGILERLIRTKTYDECAECFRREGLTWFTRINDLADLPSDPQVVANDYVIGMEDPALGTLKMVASPAQFGASTLVPRTPAPQLGEHTEEILTGVLGCDWDEIIALKDAAVIP